MQDIIRKQHQFPHPINKVWEAISIGEKISSWFIKADFKAEVGYNYTFINENTKIIGKVMVVNPVNHLEYSWEVDGTQIATIVSWKLKPNDGGTLLTLEHSGISKYPGETAIMMFNNFEGGWKACIDKLEDFLKE